MQEELEKDKSLNEIQKLEKLLCALPEKYHDIGLNRIYKLSQKYPGLYRRLMASVNNDWRLAKEYLRKGMEEGRIKEISVPVAMAMVKGTVYSFMETDILYHNGITYKQGKNINERNTKVMKDVRIIEIKESVFADNNHQADILRKDLKEKGVFLLNLMSSPGSGKTTLLKGTIEALKKELRIGVMEADIDSDVDARTIAQTGVKAIQLHTGGMCHLDADMTRQGIEALGIEDVDLAILENVGNLVCPAEFDTGALSNVMILSVPEGHDKPLKYPLMFQICDAVLINKIDVLPYFDFDMELVKEYIHMRNPKAEIFPICAKTGEGISEWARWLKEKVLSVKK